MRTLTSLLPAAFLSLTVQGEAHTAAILYDNGTNGSPVVAGGLTIKGSLAVTNSFVITNASTLTGVEFWTLVFPGATPLSVEWLITSEPFGPAVTSGTANLTYEFIHDFGGTYYDFGRSSFILPGVALTPGTYWLQLQNPSATAGGTLPFCCDSNSADTVYWVKNNGPSQAYQSSTGSQGSEAFQIFGELGTPPDPETEHHTYTFTGTVTWVHPSLAGTFNTSMTLSGSFTYDSSTPGTLFGSEPAGFSNYSNALADFVMTVGPYTASPPFGADVFSGMQVINNFFGRSGFNVTSRLTGAEFNGFNPLGGLFFETTDPGVFSSTMLKDIGDLTGWPSLHSGTDFWYMAFDCCGGQPGISGTLTSLVRQVNRPPDANAGPDQSVSCNAICQGVVALTSVSEDPDQDSLTCTWSGPFLPAGDITGCNATGTLPRGTHIITLTVDDGHGGIDTDEISVAVEDRTAPVFTSVPGAVSVSQTACSGTSVSLANALATDNCSLTSVTDDRPATYPLGITTVTFTATDGSGNQTQATATVTVSDSTPPAIDTFAPNTAVLWPPDHRMVPVTFTWRVADCDQTETTCSIISATSSEPDNGLGDGDTAGDTGINGNVVWLRSERSGQSEGRIYTITLKCTDSAGNDTTKTATVTVPKRPRHRQF